jgi:hypothetical protein
MEIPTSNFKAGSSKTGLKFTSTGLTLPAAVHESNGIPQGLADHQESGLAISPQMWSVLNESNDKKRNDLLTTNKANKYHLGSPRSFWDYFSNPNHRFL